MVDSEAVAAVGRVVCVVYTVDESVSLYGSVCIDC